MAYRSSLRMPLKKVLETVRHRYGLHVRAEDIRFGMTSTTVRLRGDTGTFLLKAFDGGVVASGQVAFGTRMGRRLRESGIPAAELIHATDGMTFVSEDGNHFQLWSFVDAEPFVPGNAAQIENSGMVLGRIHTIGSEMPVPAGQSCGSLYESVRRDLEKSWGELEESGDVHCELKRFRRVLGRVEPGRDWAALPHTVIHGDYRAQNLLFNGVRVAAVVDLETARLGARLWDVAYALAFFQAVIADGPFSESEMTAFMRAYESESALNGIEKALLPDALRLAVLKGLTLWMRIAYIDRSNNRARQWIRDYRTLFERMGRGETS